MQTSTFYTNWETPSFTKEDYKSLILEVIAAEVEEDLAADHLCEEDFFAVDQKREDAWCPYECFACPYDTCWYF